MDFSPAWEKVHGLITGAIAALPTLGLAVIVFAVFYVVARGANLLARRVTARRKRHRNLGLVLGRLAQWVMLFLGLLIAVGIVFPSIDARTLVELLGVSSVAIGFAFRDIFQNFLAGVLILLTEPFQIGDQIVVNGFEGTVEDIQTRATSIKTYDGRRIVIPNATLFTNAVTVNTAYAIRRLEYAIGIGYGDDIAEAKQLILQAIGGVDAVLHDPSPEVLVLDLGSSSVMLRARWWIQPPRRADALDSRDQVLEAIKHTLLAHGIDLPFPTQQILFHDQTEATDGDRARQREGWPAGTQTPPAPRSIAGAIMATRRNTNSEQPYMDQRP
ncbi:MAG: mechanosensitive ion channel family protein [Roseiflexaceae bacterium]